MLLDDLRLDVSDRLILGDRDRGGVRIFELALITRSEEQSSTSTSLGAIYKEQIQMTVLFDS